MLRALCHRREVLPARLGKGDGADAAADRPVHQAAAGSPRGLERWPLGPAAGSQLSWGNDHHSTKHSAGPGVQRLSLFHSTRDDTMTCSSTGRWTIQLSYVRFLLFTDAGRMGRIQSVTDCQ